MRGRTWGSTVALANRRMSMADQRSPVTADPRDNGSVDVQVPVLQRGHGLVAAIGRRVAAHLPAADLSERDPDYIRRTLPGLWLLASYYFRADVRGLHHVPERGPALLVGNHSGGNVPADTFVFTLAFSAYFGADRPFYHGARARRLVADPWAGPVRTGAHGHESGRTPHARSRSSIGEHHESSHHSASRDEFSWSRTRARRSADPRSDDPRRRRAAQRSCPAVST